MNDQFFKISDDEFNKLKQLIFDNFGIHLTDQKKGLVYTRLHSVLNKYGFKTFDEYYRFVSSDKTGKGLDELVNKISTNFTFFYREEDHFDFFIKRVLPESMEKAKQRNENDLRFWCAGCASGEEPYTIIMLMMEAMGGNYPLWNSGILATDISDNALGFAKEAIYPSDRLQKLPPLYRNKYFEKISDDEYKVIERVKKEVTFRRFNLMNTTFPFKKKFQAIFCRNVMIYFNQQTRDELVGRYEQMLEPGGYLFLGHSETISSKMYSFKYVMPAVYRKEGP